MFLFLFVIGLIIDQVLARNLGQGSFWLLVCGGIYSIYQEKMRRYWPLRCSFFLLGLWLGINSFLTAVLLVPVAELFWRIINILRPEDNRQLKLNL